MPVLDPSDIASETMVGAKQAAGEAAKGALGFGSEFIRQLFGLKPGQKVPTEEEIKEGIDKDDEFSDAAYAETLTKVHAVYSAYEAKKKREAQFKAQREEVEVKKKDVIMDQLATKRKHYQDVNVAMGKASAETGRSYGAGE